MTVHTIFNQKLDIWTKTQTANDSGQLIASWALASSGVRCHFIPRIATTRTKPTAEETEIISVFFPPDVQVGYGSRIYNVVDRYGNQIEAGPLEINSILKQPGFGGRIHHIAIKARRVIES